ncbi:MAG: hypothetical protein HY278_05330 [candidate division NC10 bacterium]|nr:hypothetical protein [candidate division NC10 bacterium]
MRRDAGLSGDYAFRPSRGALRAFKDLPAEVKLDWLEQAAQFVEAFVSPAKRARWDQRWGQDHVATSFDQGAEPTPQR